MHVYGICNFHETKNGISADMPNACVNFITLKVAYYLLDMPFNMYVFPQCKDGISSVVPFLHRKFENSFHKLSAEFVPYQSTLKVQHICTYASFACGPSYTIPCSERFKPKSRNSRLRLYILILVPLVKLIRTTPLTCPQSVAVGVALPGAQ